MTSWINFITSHPYLWAAVIIIVILLLLLEFEAVWRGIRCFNPNEVSLWMNREAIVVDINEAADFTQGHILGAIHVAFSQLPQKINTLDAYKTKLIIIVANQERQAFQASVMLQQHGFKEVGILSGGLPAWKNANLPLVKK